MQVKETRAFGHTKAARSPITLPLECDKPRERTRTTLLSRLIDYHCDRDIICLSDESFSLDLELQGLSYRVD